LEDKRAKQVLPGSRVGSGVAQIMYIHISKCKNDNIIEREKQRKDTR
jgi:hypothetical protein